MSGRQPHGPEDLAAGALFAGRFRIERELGRGGMGVVYAVTDENTDRRVAVKIMARKHAEDPEFVERFKREGKAVGALNHENIVPIYDANVTADGVRYLVMEYLEGISLRAMLNASRGRRLSLPHGARIAIQIADALRVAHSKGIAHRDIKPENVFVGKKGRAWLLDFGLAKRANASAQTDEQKVLGTHRYMAPEQILGKERPDCRVDLYQLGCVIFEMWTGELPYEAGNDPDATADEILAAHVLGEATPLQSVLPDTPARAVAIVDKLLAKDPEQRYANAEELGFDLYDLLVELLGPNHPAAVKSARSRADQSGEWAAFVEPDVVTGGTQGAGAPPPGMRADTAPLEPTFRPVDRSPSWVPRPSGGAANDITHASTEEARRPPEARAASYATPGAPVTARGTVRLLPGPAAAPPAASAPAQPTPAAPRWNVTEPLPQAPRAASPITTSERTAPVPSAALLDALASAEQLSADEEALWDDDDSGESRRRVLFHRYLTTMAPHFDTVDSTAVQRAIDAYLFAAEASVRAMDAPTEATSRQAPPTPPAFVTPAQTPEANAGRRSRRWIAAVAAGFVVAAAAAGVRVQLWSPPAEGAPAAASVDTPAAATAPPTTATAAPAEPAASSSAPEPAPPATTVAADTPAAPPRASSPKAPTPKPAGAPPKAAAPSPPPSPKTVAPAPTPSAAPAPPAPQGTKSRLPSNAAPRPLRPKAAF